MDSLMILLLQTLKEQNWPVRLPLKIVELPEQQILHAVNRWRWSMKCDLPHLDKEEPEILIEPIYGTPEWPIDTAPSITAADWFLVHRRGYDTSIYGDVDLLIVDGYGAFRTFEEARACGERVAWECNLPLRLWTFIDLDEDTEVERSA
jgi:hypothetical protein